MTAIYQDNQIDIKRIAYADPPYIGQAKKHYHCKEIDHKELLERLQTYDGWALSASSTSLKYILGLCPSNVRIAVWVKPFCSFKPNVNPAYAWEPVIFMPTRKLPGVTNRDWIAANMTLKRGLSGVKPALFCNWLFSILGANPNDCFDDLFPGSGAVTRAWEYWRAVEDFKRNQQRAIGV